MANKLPFSPRERHKVLFLAFTEAGVEIIGFFFVIRYYQKAESVAELKFLTRISTAYVFQNVGGGGERLVHPRAPHRFSRQTGIGGNRKLLFYWIKNWHDGKQFPLLSLPVYLFFLTLQPIILNFWCEVMFIAFAGWRLWIQGCPVQEYGGQMGFSP